MTKKIIALDIENMGGIKAFHIEPNGEHVVIGGPNEAGKSTVVWDLAGAIRGAKGRRSQKVRMGSEEGHVVVDFGDLIVKWISKADGKDQLDVKTADGAKYNGAQAVLNKLWGNRSTEALEFFKGDKKQRAETVARLAGIDLVDIAKRIKAPFDERTVVNRLAKKLQAQADGIKVPPGTPDEPVDVVALEAKISEAAATNQKNATLRDRLVEVEAHHKSALEDVTNAEAQAITSAKAADATATEMVSEAETSLTTAKEQAAQMVADAEAALQRANERAKQHRASAEEQANGAIADKYEARDKVAAQLEKGRSIVAKLEDVDTSQLREDLGHAQETNKAVEAKATKAQRQADADAEVAKSDELTKEINSIKKERDDAIAAADLKIDGLGLEDGDVTLHGKPSDILCTKEQLEISIQLSIAADPEIGVLLIDKWGDLDEKNRELIFEIADAADMQIITTVVGTKDDDITVIIVDGEIYEPPTGDEK